MSSAGSAVEPAELIVATDQGTAGARQAKTEGARVPASGAPLQLDGRIEGRLTHPPPPPEGLVIELPWCAKCDRQFDRTLPEGDEGNRLLAPAHCPRCGEQAAEKIHCRACREPFIYPAPARHRDTPLWIPPICARCATLPLGWRDAYMEHGDVATLKEIFAQARRRTLAAYVAEDDAAGEDG